MRWTNGWNCLWWGHSVDRYRPLIPNVNRPLLSPAPPPPSPETHRPLPYIQDEGTIAAGFSPITVASHQCYTNGKPKEGTAWYSDGSKLEVPSLEGQMDRAGVALSCGPLIIIARVTGPQTSYRGELQGVALVTATTGY